MKLIDVLLLMKVATIKEAIGCGLIVATHITGLLVACDHVIQFKVRAINGFTGVQEKLGVAQCPHIAIL
jgi:hypothetical protein